MSTLLVVRPTCLALLLGPVAALAQSATIPTPTAAPVGEPVTLSAFEVSTNKDLGYAASSAMTATRTNEKLENLPNSISVMTQELLQDLAVNNYFDAVEFGTSSENIYNGNGVRGAAIGRPSGNQINFRGLASFRQLRDGFPWYMPQDIYNTERIELSRGPGGLSYGDVDAGGIINISTKRARLADAYSVQDRYDNFGTRRVSLDLNHALVAGRVGARLNAINGQNETWRQRAGATIKGVAGAVRLEPFKNNHRTVLDVTFERGNNDADIGNTQLNDHTVAYLRGSGTNALDADPLRSGVQTNGVGMARMRPTTAAPGTTNNDHLPTYIDGKIYNMLSTPTAVFRTSSVQRGAGSVTDPLDPVNPRAYFILPMPESIIPRAQSWASADNRQNDIFHAYTIELRHQFSDKLSLLIAHNGQKDDGRRNTNWNQNDNVTANRNVYIDVNPSLADPANPAGLVRNPRFEQMYVVHNTTIEQQGHAMANWRAVGVYDLALPASVTQRLVLSGGYRHERYFHDVFTEALSREEIARRGWTGAAALYTNNLLFRRHYLGEGNSDAALANPNLPGVSGFFRANTNSANQRYDQSITEASFSALGSYWGGRVRTSVGLSRNRWLQSITANTRADAATGEQLFVDANNTAIPNRGFDYVGAPLLPFSDQWATNQTYGGVWHVTPWLSFTGGYFESTLFADNVGRDLLNNPLQPKAGEGADYGLRLSLPGDRANLSITRFATRSENEAAAISAAARTELQSLLGQTFNNTSDYRDSTSKGYEVELLVNLTRAWTLRGVWGDNSVKVTRFFPLLGAKLTEARAAASARGLNPDVATTVTAQFLSDSENGALSTARRTASMVTRYSFLEGSAKGLSVGGSLRWQLGIPRTAGTVDIYTVLPGKRLTNVVIASPFVSYRRKIGRQTWLLQLNANNIFNWVYDTGTTYTAPRYTDPRQFVTTVTVNF